MRSQRVNSSGNSLEVTRIPKPSRHNRSMRRYSSALAPTSTPRVGSSNRSTLGCVNSQRPMIAFCWLPPLRLVMGVSMLGVFTPSWSTVCWAMARSPAERINPSRVASSNMQRVMLWPTLRLAKIPSRLRSSVTRATPARIAAAGWRKQTSRPSSRIVPSGTSALEPNKHSKSSVRPAPIRPATPTISPRRRVARRGSAPGG